MRSLVRLLAIASMAGTTLAWIVASPAAAAAVPNPINGCTPTGSQAWVHMTGTVTHQLYVTYYTSGGSPSTNYAFNDVHTVKLNYVFCTNRANSIGLWQVYAAAIAGGTNYGFDSSLNVTGKYGGYSLFPYEVLGGPSTGNKIKVNPTFCTQGANPFTTLGKILSLPVPGLNLQLAIAKALLATALSLVPGPSGKCRALGTATVPIVIATTGASAGNTSITRTNFTWTDDLGPWRLGADYGYGTSTMAWPSVCQSVSCHAYETFYYTLY
jgi:hypothetical protein